MKVLSAHDWFPAACAVDLCCLAVCVCNLESCQKLVSCCLFVGRVVLLNGTQAAVSEGRPQTVYCGQRTQRSKT